MLMSEGLKSIEESLEARMNLPEILPDQPPVIYQEDHRTVNNRKSF